MICFPGEGGLESHEKSRFKLEKAPFQRRELSVGEVIHATSDLQFSVGRVSALDGESVTVDWDNGMLHGFNFEDGKVSYKNRYVRTPYYEKDLDIIGSFGDLSASPANTHIIKHADKFLALEEAHLPWEVDENLETKGA